MSFLKGSPPASLVSRSTNNQLSDHTREQEALAALAAAKDSRRHGNVRKAKAIIEHALALAPNHPDVLTEYGLFHEVLENDVLEADLCYAKALAFDPNHSEALVWVLCYFY
ncbi:unnamed protein product [Strongylus vulgaris]|uniref:Uncharacterized protein n=1 Tax=Strongylus vulgaris TaxID=40348 RepID=A0A3P7J4G4_STRVU|nr:unnamed protein product [Strongylus vulgaris]